MQPLATIIEEYAANYTFPHHLEPTIYKLMKREAQRLSHQQDHQPTNTTICPKCHQQYHYKIINKHQKTKECTIGQFVLKWLLSSNTIKQHMLKFLEADLIKLVLEYGLEDSKLSQHPITSKRQFELYSQNQETMYLHNSSDDESTLPDEQGNLRTITNDPILEKQIQTFRACTLTDYLIDVKNDGIY